MNCYDPLSRIKLNVALLDEIYTGTLMFEYFIYLNHTPNIRYTMYIHSFNYDTRTLRVLDAKEL